MITIKDRPRLPATISAILLLMSGLAGCRTADRTIDCTKYQLDARTTPESGKVVTSTFPLTLIMLDISDNSPATAERIAQATQPYINAAVTRGTFLKVAASGGEGTKMAVSNCFDGTHPFLVKRINSGRETKDRQEAAKELPLAMADFVRTIKVAKRGSATRLFASIPEEVEQVISVPGAHIGTMTVVVWTDLLGNTDRSDCLSVNNQPASPRYAEAIVRRCFEVGQLKRLGNLHVRLIGVGESATNRAQSVLASYLAADLCRRLSSDCKGIGATDVGTLR